jgi:hypothetical protein
VGTSVAVSPEDDGRVHINFDTTGETHRYAEQSWVKMSRMQSAIVDVPATSKSRNVARRKVEAKKRKERRKMRSLRRAERDAVKTTNPMRQRAADLAKASEQAEDAAGTLQTAVEDVPATYKSRNVARRKAEAKKRKERRAERDAVKTTNPMRQRAADLAKSSEQAGDAAGTLQTTSNPMQASSDATGFQLLQPTTNTMHADPSLPDGWRAHSHQKKGVYYHNASTGATQWTPPRESGREQEVMIGEDKQV